MSLYDNEYFEADASPMTTLQRKWLDEYFSPANFFERFCSTNPSAPECRIYED